MAYADKRNKTIFRAKLEAIFVVIIYFNIIYHSYKSRKLGFIFDYKLGFLR